jgi:signal peptidase I
MGDNRDHSYDSRFWGYVDLREVKGKAFMIYWSWDKEDFGVRWGRLFNMIE